MQKVWKAAKKISSITRGKPIRIFLFLNIIYYTLIGMVGGGVFDLCTDLPDKITMQVYVLFAGYAGVGVGLFGGLFFLLRMDE